MVVGLGDDSRDAGLGLPEGKKKSKASLYTSLAQMLQLSAVPFANGFKGCRSQKKTA